MDLVTAARAAAALHAPADDAELVRLGREFDRAVSEMDTAVERVDALQEQILEARATTIAGVGVKARAARVALAEVWREPADRPQSVCSKLLNDICAATSGQ